MINDLKQGTVTLPLIYMLQKKSYRKIIALVENISDVSSIRDIIRKMVIKSGALKYSLGEAYKAIDIARRDLNNFAPSAYRDYLHLILDKLPERVNTSKLLNWQDI